MEITDAVAQLNTTKILIYVKNTLLGPIVKLVLLAIIVFITLRIVRFILGRLQRRDVISSTVAEHLYKLTSLAVYATAAVIIIYMFTSIREVIYALIAIFVAILAANWSMIADITAYYIMLASRQVYRSASLVELPRLGVKGKIVSINMLHTRIRTPAGRIVYIPNHIIVSEPIVQLTGIQGVISLELEVKLPKDVRTSNSLEYIERKIRNILGEARIATRPQDIVVLVDEATVDKARLIVQVPIAGVEPRPSTINNVVSILVNGLKELEPSIRVKTVT
ncbi:hypothetical protein Hbut_0913 [Hyperthermus butylicus DSM 5456]|uniref:Mechanosensitive ion channel MscS domain-containing protein n=1 Tax=Hyperthermus butylicus (strain DSM 5456 / JCM 9403 / PLM1-5) TaxID=415426 RepID=A2BLA0_HYPBU|nr:hypothetical protein Hbut_0913 [Hyperthermus butylicus DSM 5456]